METMKPCSRCGQTYPLSAFIKNRLCKDGRAGVCRECSNKYNRDWKRKNRNRLVAKRKAIYAETHGAIWKERERKRKEEYPLRVRGQMLRSGMRNRARKKQWSFDSNIFTVKFLMEWLASNPHCECCGCEFDISFKENGVKNDLSPSIDRFNNKKGYVIGNVSLLCWRCNNLKRDATVEELEQLIRWMKGWKPVHGNENR